MYLTPWRRLHDRQDVVCEVMIISHVHNKLKGPRTAISGEPRKQGVG